MRMRFIVAGLLGLLLAVSSRGADEAWQRALEKGRVPLVPAELLEGRATLAQVQAWVNALDPETEGAKNAQVLERDVDCDGRDEWMRELLTARGTTGSRHYLLFDPGEAGYRFVGSVGQILRALPGDEPESCLQVQYASVGGGGIQASLYHWKLGKLNLLGRGFVRAGDSGTEEGRAIWTQLESGDLDETKLRALFDRLPDEPPAAK